MVIPRYENAACAKPGVDPNIFVFESVLTDQNKEAMFICLGCPERYKCLADVLANPKLHEKEIRAGLPASRDMVKRLTAAPPGMPKDLY